MFNSPFLLKVEYYFIIEWKKKVNSISQMHRLSNLGGGFWFVGNVDESIEDAKIIQLVKLRHVNLRVVKKWGNKNYFARPIFVF